MATECCDVMVAHSPPLFTAHSTAKPAAELVLYQNFRLVMTHQKNVSPMSVRRLNARSSSNSPTRDDRQHQQAASSKPRRPCLVIRTDSDASIGSSSSSSGSSSSDENEPSSPTRRKKKVVFADDRGLSLTQVRLMSEPSNQPPKLMTVSPYLNPQPIAAVNNCVNRQPVDQQWHLRFQQPASSYLDFRKRLDENNVSLENVIIKSPDKRIVGTVKVRNLSYDKEVFVRSTRDRWATHQDTLCTYVQNNAMVNAASGNGGGSGLFPGVSASAQNPVTAIYDTFSFRLPLPADATSMEFAVCYKSARFEFWDSNDGNNYWLSLGAGCSQQLPAAGPPPLQQHAAGSTSCMSSADFEQHLRAAKQPVHYFGSQSGQNSWNVWRDQKDNDSSAYW
ncbi:protein phosphatase 1 regulatory subunit 3B-B-like isoform X2 [Sipha flava]|nr:protein phosphatase 1 regulatory subunit 3B-B-like isoform X2 [Sipha flava]XP_025417690.1 protein phosphatase 1 regulatory subunit 3B-B-like isoform X2 [Sipha flava]